uniref:Major facilitator superfamily (MFS) profile domain-containing protein n=1 Tax=Chromera velia CCMP2878 TaxID=1169474 RepID=A0A0G4I086_9ALVE|eukprot:Cvel_9857.t1-p1 / transcript=Cvel_9857.t1 / gene=Cvel_9857 / organism=Chromera_velia_CCMP2878 / gene_product=hypothetical protein / transcript_product=hypothetical protein / location=Cvel_scaffold580:71938-73378(+) / protein_length=303 / sequence_SO=supercontig / SO=protein_coding / is_pseudo=false
MVGSPLGGLISDRAQVAWPEHGRVVVTQLVLLIKVPLMVLLFAVLPRSPEAVPMYFMVVSFVGLLSGWSNAGVEKPLIAELIHPVYRAAVYAMVRALEIGGMALLGAPVVGVLAEKIFGYESAADETAVRHHPGAAPHEMAEPLRNSNCEALARALLVMTAGPWLMAAVLYCLLHATVKPDKRLARSIWAQIERNLMGTVDEESDGDVTTEVGEQRSSVSSRFGGEAQGEQISQISSSRADTERGSSGEVEGGMSTEDERSVEGSMTRRVSERGTAPPVTLSASGAASSLNSSTSSSAFGRTN